MPHKLRTLPATLLSVAALALAGCGGSDETPADAGTQSAIDMSPSAEADVDSTPTPTPTPTAQESSWVTMTDEPSGISFAMPELAEPQPNTATIADGTSVALRNYSAMTGDDIEVGFNVIDTSGEDYDFDAGVEGVAATLGGEVVAKSEVEVAGNPALDVEMTYGEGYIVFFQLVTGEEHIVQSLASGPESDRAAVEKTYQQLSESVEVR